MPSLSDIAWMADNLPHLAIQKIDEAVIALGVSETSIENSVRVHSKFIVGLRANPHSVKIFTLLKVLRWIEGEYERRGIVLLADVDVGKKGDGA